MASHGERAHSKFSASASERWFKCPGSVELSEGIPDRKNEWSIEGEKAHEVLESFLKVELSGNDGAVIAEHEDLTTSIPKVMKPPVMISHARNAASFILGQWERLPHSKLMIESRVYLSFIHPEMFGTFDSAILDHFGTLHVFDFKYGTYLVSPKNNYQMLFYGIGLAHKYKWNFKKVRLWIVQPRARGYDGPMFWDLHISELRKFVATFEEAVERVLTEPDVFVEGKWCHFCKANRVCPLKAEKQNKKALAAFDPV